MSQNVNVDQLRVWTPRWRSFLTDQGNWYASRLNESSTVYAIPSGVTDLRLKSLYGLDESELQAEVEFAELCEDQLAIAVASDLPISYRWLAERIALPNVALAKEMLDLGWTKEHLRQLKTAVRESSSIVERTSSALGRLVCATDFLKQRLVLQDLWAALPDETKPRFPIQRSAIAPTRESIENALDEPVMSQDEAGHDRAEFTRAFDRFCDDWRITGFATWELPEIDGPKWPDPLAEVTEKRGGRAVFDTPWHFPLQASDGLGPQLKSAHDHAKADRGVDDPRSWRTYRQMFLVDFWGHVLRSRYTDRQPRGFVSRLEGFVADIVQLDVVRVAKLRKLISAFRRGTRQSLAGTR